MLHDERPKRNRSRSRRFAHGSLAGTGAVALAVGAVAQNALAATVSSVYQAVYTANSINGVGDAGTGKLLFPTRVTVPSNNKMTLTVQQGTYFYFNLGVAISGDPNAAAGAAYDQANGFEEPAQLGVGVVAVNIFTGNVNVVAPLYTDLSRTYPERTNGAVDHIGGSLTSIGGALTDPGNVNSATGEVGPTAYPGGGWLFAADAYQPASNIAAYTGSAENAANQLFNQMGYEAVGVGITQISTQIRSKALNFVTLLTSTLDLQNSSIEPSFNYRLFNPDTDTINNVPALTIDVIPDSGTDAPEPAGLGALSSAVTLLLCRRRRPRTM